MILNLLWCSIALIGEENVPLVTLAVQNNQTNNTTRTSIPLDSLGKSTLDKLDTLLFRHVRSPVCITVTVNVGRSTSTDGVLLLVKGTSQRNAVNLTTVARIVAGDNYSSTEVVFVGVGEFAEQGSGLSSGWWLSGVDGKVFEVVVDNVGDGLGIGSGAGSAAPYRIVNLGELIRYSVGDVCSGGGSAVRTCGGLALPRLALRKPPQRTQNDTALVVDGHARVPISIQSSPFSILCNAHIEVPKLFRHVSFHHQGRVYPVNSLYFSLLEMLHIDVYAICEESISTAGLFLIQEKSRTDAEMSGNHDFVVVVVDV